ncbi:MAG: CotH kinase family protein [Planctomycetota bacterium]
MNPSLPIVLLLLLCPALNAEQIRINEVVASNVSGLVDGDGETSDWIELWNYGAAPVDLGGWGLSDDPADPFKWMLPLGSIPASGSILVRASGKGTAFGGLEFVTLVDEGETWDYWPGTQAVPAGWYDLGFTPVGWSQGPSGFGFGDGDDGTLVSAHSVFARTEIVLTQADIDSFERLYVHVDYDDGFVAYLNGVEVHRKNIVGPDPPHNAFADGSHEAELYTGGVLEGRQIPDLQSLLVVGTNVFAAQVHNTNSSSNDLSLIPFLTAVRSSAIPAAPDPRLQFPNYRPLHTNYKLSSAGESLVLTDATGVLIDSLDTGRVFADTSVGLDPAGASLLVFQNPTPEALNTSPGRSGYADMTSASPEGGIYPGSLSVTLTIPPGAVVHYSLNGEEPTLAHPQYTGPVSILPGITPFRARAFEAGLWGSQITTETYVVGPVPQALPMVSLVTEPDLLFGSGGIYVNSFGREEVPAHIEFFELGGERMLSQDVGLKLHGGFSARLNAQRSLRFIARGGYGSGEMEVDFFPSLGFETYKQILFRNAGNDWCRAHMRDALMHRITEPEDLEIMSLRPTVIFINGEYYGIHNMRERQDEDYLASRKGVDPDNVDILELRNGDVVEGDSEHWDNLLDFVSIRDVNDPLVWADIETRVDADNLAAYCIMEVWCGNDDWPQNNIKWWRERTPEGRWRWMMYDTDFAFGRFDSVNVDVLNHLYGSSAETAVLFRALMENDDYRKRFINRYADYLNEHFLPQRTRQVMFGVYQEMTPEIDRHMARWRSEGPFGGTASRSTWIDEMRDISDYFGARNDITRQQIRSRYGIPGDFTLSLDVSPAGSGSVQLTAIEIDEAWSGEYFRFVPVELTAVPAPGWEFDSWSDPLLPQQPNIEVESDGAPIGVTAIFRPAPVPEMVIQEINYNSSAGFDPGDWVELYNNGAAAVDLSGWSFEDSGSSWIIPAGTIVPVGGYLVLAQDLNQFTAVYGGSTGAIGDLGFGFSGSGELLSLRDGGGVLIDEVEYDDVAPWPTAPDGTGPTLELIDPNLDNNDGANWQASVAIGGSPGS